MRQKRAYGAGIALRDLLLLAYNRSRNANPATFGLFQIPLPVTQCESCDKIFVSSDAD